MDPIEKPQQQQHQKQEEEEEEEEGHLHIVQQKQTPQQIATASLSLSLSLSLPQPPTHFFTNQKSTSLFSNTTTRAKIPTQAFSLSHLSLSSTSTPLSLSKPTTTTTLSPSPLRFPLPHLPRRSSDPSSAAALRRASVVWFRNDLRAHDNECLNSAHNESVSILPVYCFDPREYGKSSSGFDKTGPYRARFVIDSVSDLRTNLQNRGSGLIVRVGHPEAVLVELAKAVRADAVYVHREVSSDEVKAEEKIEAAMKDEGVEVKYFWGSTLYHLDDLPFSLEDMPSNYSGFREKVKGLNVRDTIAALDQLKCLPSTGDVQPGDIPSLSDLGLAGSSSYQEGKAAANTMVGGETEAVQKLEKFASECQAQPPKSTNGSHDSIYGANFSCKISPWLTTGCISPRFMFETLKKTAPGFAAARSNDGGNRSSDTGTSWLMYELLWRDFFRFITKKYSSPKKQLDAVPATACTGAIA